MYGCLIWECAHVPRVVTFYSFFVKSHSIVTSAFFILAPPFIWEGLCARVNQIIAIKVTDMYVNVIDHLANLYFCSDFIFHLPSWADAPTHNQGVKNDQNDQIKELSDCNRLSFCPTARARLGERVTHFCRWYTGLRVQQSSSTKYIIPFWNILVNQNVYVNYNTTLLFAIQINNVQY